ncbi:T9SS type A sorting domain-containing protein [Hymenobacter sp. GOD-10R]|uniref:T9SS type A sorting domain-containing protein n=1 Tax=Hymenobacter sp. GOD-10R TaxID=3093922 RepID=UPI002D7754F1|nr:T9SS type A sorting domain-containing protein [Hymenobacter sp. GOD-10R]WRQ29857.1 T9SS type A sorting domain-containing protein [Hymenobacter sp. GOD-10R]
MHPYLHKIATGLLSIAFSLTLHTAFGQVEWQQLYGGKTDETCTSLLPQADGGYLLIGTDRQKGQKLYLIRTDARGRQLWNKHILPAGLPSFAPLYTFQDADGNALIACSDGGLTQRGNYYVTKVDQLGNVADTWQINLGSSKRSLGGLTRRPDGGFVAAAVDYSVSGGQSILFYLDANGRKQREEPLVISADRGGLVHNLLAVPGGFLAAVSIQRLGGGVGEFPTKLIFFSDQGERGAESELPKYGYQERVQSVLSLGGNDYLVMGDQVNRITIGSPTPQWTKVLSYSQQWVHPQGAVPTPNGGFLFYGYSTVSSHVIRLHLVQTDANGNLLDGLPAGQVTSAKMLASGLSGGLAGLYAVPGTDTYVVAGYRQGQGDEDIFLSSGSFGQLKVATTTIMQAWPNPVSDTDLLNVSSMVALGDALELYNLQGKLVHAWPRTGSGDAQLSLQNVPPGIYMLVGINGSGKRSSIRINKR